MLLVITVFLLIIIKFCDFKSIYLTWKYPKLKKFLYFPLVGHLGLVKNMDNSIKGFHATLDTITNESEKMLHFLNYRAIVFYKPHHMEILFKHPATQHKAQHYNFLKDSFGDSLLLLNGDKWRSRRKAISPVMKSRVIGSFVEEISRFSELLADEFEPNLGRTFDAHHAITKNSLDMFLSVVIGVDDLSRSNEYISHVHTIAQSFMLRFLSIWKRSDFLYKLTKEGKIMDNAMRGCRKMVSNIINTRRVIYDNNPIEDSIDDSKMSYCHRIIDFLISLQFPDRAIQHESALLITAGYDTTQNAIGCALLMMAMHPEIQERAYQEVMEILGPDRCMQQEDISKFVYLKKVINETLRLFPSVSNVTRVTTEDITIDGNIIPTNTNLVLSIFTLHRSSIYWCDPLKFDPERFNQEEVKKRPNFSFLPFLAGTRNCFGAPFAIMNLVTTLAILLRRYEWFTTYKCVEDIKMEFGITMKCIDGVLLRPEERKII